MPYKNREDRQANSKHYYQKHKDKIINYSKTNAPKYAERKRRHEKKFKFENPEKYILGRIKRKAKAKGLEFNLSIEDIAIPEVCPILLIPIKLNLGNPHYDSISVDRIDNCKGYIKGNVRIISHRANTYKNNMNISIVERLLKYMLGEL